MENVKLDPNDIFTNANEFTNLLLEFKTINFSSNNIFEPDFKIQSNTIPLTPINKKFDILFNELISFQEKGYQNIIICSSEEQKERFHQIIENELREIHITTIVGNLREGFIDHDNKISIYTDHQIFNRHHKFISKTRFKDKQAITLKQLTNLQIGDFVTHIDHGVGEFAGLHKIDNNGKKQESIKLIYKDGDILYISVHSLHKISKYSGKEGHRPKINQLGSSKWQTTKNKTKTRIKKIAFNLIQLYAKRKNIDGFSYSPDTYLQHELEASFMWEDTPDQTSSYYCDKRRYGKRYTNG